MFVSEVAYYADNAYYGNFIQIGFVMQSSLTNRYGYRSGAAGPAGGTSTGAASVDLINPCCGRALEPEQVGMQATNSVPGPIQGFTFTATANLDQDGTVDQWYVNDIKYGLHRANPDDITS
jgi:hypothetical protein